MYEREVFVEVEGGLTREIIEHQEIPRFVALVLEGRQDPAGYGLLSQIGSPLYLTY